MFGNDAREETNMIINIIDIFLIEFFRECLICVFMSFFFIIFNAIIVKKSRINKRIVLNRIKNVLNCIKNVLVCYYFLILKMILL